MILGGAFIVGIAPAFAQAIAIDRVLVVVNEKPIMMSEYQTRHRRESLQNAAAPFDGRIDERILNYMIDDRIQAQVASQRGILVSAEEVERAVEFIARQNQLTVAELFAKVGEDGITAEQFKASVHEQEVIRRLVDRVVGSRIGVSESEIENYLASHPELIPSNQNYEISRLFISLQGKTESQARGEFENLAHIRNAILEGRDFAQSAREFSDGEERGEGGYLGWRNADQLPPPFVDALQQTAIEGVSEIVPAADGLHLLKLHNRREQPRLVAQQLVRHILIRPGDDLSENAAKARAKELRERIVGGEDFATVARAHSADPSSAINGGMLGWVSPGEFPRPLEITMSNLKLNEVSQPVRAPGGFHLVEVLDRRQADISMDIAAQRARQKIFNRKAASFYDNWYGALRDAAHIEYVGVDAPTG